MITTPYKLVLGSQSPRRKQLLAGCGFEFDIRVKDTNEDWPDGMPVKDIAEYLARKKADALRGELGHNELLVTSDTTVLLEGRIYNKPADADDAVRILSELSGKTHSVVTGVCLSTKDVQKSFSETSLVVMKEISPDHIRYYVEQYKPFDKAGAYAIQEWIGLTHILRMEGSYSNIMGLPTERVFEEIINFNR